MPPSRELVEAVQAFFACSVLIALAVGLGWLLLRMQRAASRVSLAERRFEPTLVWLLLIPVFHLWWAFRVAKGVPRGVAAAREAAALPARPSGRGVGAGMAWSLLGAGITLLLAIAAGSLAGIAVATNPDDTGQVAFFRGVASLFGTLTLLLWIASGACLIAFVHQVEAASEELEG